MAAEAPAARRPERPALLLTALARPHHLEPVLASWTDLIGPTRDRGYSTWNSPPGFETGFETGFGRNLDTRVFPSHGHVSVPELLETAPSFAPHQPVRAFREVAPRA